MPKEARKLRGCNRAPWRPAPKESDAVLDPKHPTRFFLYVEYLGAQDRERAYEIWWSQLKSETSGQAVRLPEDQRKCMFFEKLDFILAETAENPGKKGKEYLSPLNVFHSVRKVWKKPESVENEAKVAWA